MCYSGKCRWENHMGDCNFPHDKKVREKYPLPVCDIPEDENNEERLDEIYKDIQEILKQKSDV